MLAFALVAKAQYQFPNSDFESDFVSAYPSKGYTEPTGWHGYATISGGVGSLGRSGEKLAASEEVREGATGSHSVCVTATSIIGIIANGVMTNGQIYSGSMSATDGSGNYNFSDQTNTGDADTYGDNDQFYTTFTGRPDYMKVWLKFVPAEDKGNARVSVYLHKDGTVMYDPTDNVEDFSIVVAHAEESIPTNDGAWTQYTLPFDYDGEGQYDGTAIPALILATFSTNETPGVGTKGDSLYIDDIEMVYLSELKSATFNGEEITFTDGEASVDAAYDATLLECIADGVGASIELDEPTEENGNVLTITVKGDNISEDETNYHTYTIQFTGAEESETTAITYTDELVVTVNGESLDPMETSVTVEYLEDETINFVLKNFVLDMDGTQLAVGNIELDGIVLNDVDGEEYKTLSFDGTTRITRGDLEGVTMWWGPMLGNVPIVMEGKITDDKLYVTLSISLSTLSMDIDVTFGTDFEEEEVEEGPVVERTIIYTDVLAVTMGDYETEPVDADVTVEYMSDGTINFILKNFVLEQDGTDLAIGNIELDGIMLEDAGEYKTFSFEGTTTIGKGDLSGVLIWFGPMLGEVPFAMEGKITDDKLYVTMDTYIELVGEDIHIVFGSDFEEEVEEGPVVERTIIYTDELVVTMDNYVTEPVDADVTVEYMSDGTINFVLKNFILEQDGTDLAIGNIEISDIMLEDGEEYKTFSFEGTTKISSGDLSGVFIWFGPMLGDVPFVMEGKITDDKLYVTLETYIELIGESIYIVFGSDFEEEVEEVEADLALHATWDGEELSDGAVIQGTYDPERLVITESEGTVVDTDYDDVTCVLTITITDQNDESNSVAYHISFTIPTGLNAVGDTLSDEAVYDLSGRRIAGKPRKGIYVIGGKKVVVR